MVDKKANKLYIHNPTKLDMAIADVAITVEKIRHIHFIVDLEYIRQDVKTDDKFWEGSTTKIGDFIHTIRDYINPSNKEMDFYNGVTRIHFTIIEDPYTSTVNKILRRENIINRFRLKEIPENRYTIEFTNNFYYLSGYNQFIRICRVGVQRISTSLVIPYSELHTDNNNYLVVAGFEKESIVDGPGMRYTIFVQGCINYCEGCHNPETWNLDGGKVMRIDDIFNDIIKNPMLNGVTFSGGEPTLQAPALYELYKMLDNYYKSINKPFNFISYTGSTLKKLKANTNKYMQRYLNCLDYIVDGRFDITKKSYNCKFRGSSNQKMYKHDKVTDRWEEIYPVTDTK